MPKHCGDRRSRQIQRLKQEGRELRRGIQALPEIRTEFMSAVEARKRYGVTPLDVAGPTPEEMIVLLRSPATGMMPLGEDSDFWDERRCGLQAGRYDPFCIFENLGRMGRFTIGDQETWVYCPPAVAVWHAIETFRLQWLRQLRQALGTPEDFLERFTNPLEVAQYIASTAGATIQDKRQLVLVDEWTANSPQAAIQYFPPLIVAANVMLTFLRHRYRIALESDVGWHRGRLVEMELMLTRIRPQQEWGPNTRRFFDRFYVLPDDLGGFVLPGGSPCSGGGKSNGRDTTAVDEPRRDPERILYCMGLSQYREIRSLSSRNPYEYVALVFNRNRVGLDTARWGNRFFGLEGAISECLDLAQRRKGEIRTSPLCRVAFVHDVHGGWRTRVRQWLG